MILKTIVPWGIQDTEINIGLDEYVEHKNPIFDKEYWWKIGRPTLFDLEESLKGEKEDVEDNNPLDEEGNICVHWFWDIRTGELKKDMFKTINSFPIGSKTYKTICIHWSNKIFIVDFENKKSFPGCEKWTSGHINSIESFWNREIIIFWWSDNIVCMDNNGKYLWKRCLSIKKIKYGNIDILVFTWRVNPDYDVNDLRTYNSYLWSDDKRYQPKHKETEEWEILFFSQVKNSLKEKKIISLDMD